MRLALLLLPTWPRAIARTLAGIVPRVLLVLTLVAGQQALVMHELEHGFSDLSPKHDSTQPSDHVCEKCLGYASLGHAQGTAGTPAVTPVLAFGFDLSLELASALTPLWRAYLSRAPPLPLT
jgi:hypothetical protein